jgi:hypothetical protein
MFVIVCLGLDNIDQNIPGFGDDTLGNDGDGDSLTKSKLNLNANKDKKKPFFKKVKIKSTLFLLIINHNRQKRLLSNEGVWQLTCLSFALYFYIIINII